MEALAGVVMLVVVLRKPMTCGQGVVSLRFDDSEGEFRGGHTRSRAWTQPVLAMKFVPTICASFRKIEPF